MASSFRIFTIYGLKVLWQWILRTHWPQISDTMIIQKRRMMISFSQVVVIPREARKFELGETTYYVVLVVSAIIWQGFFLGAIGIIFCASSLLSGIVIAVLLPITEIFAVIFYHEKFQAEKGVSLVLSLWGFVSYFYGEIKHNKESKRVKKKENNKDSSGQDTENPQSVPNP